MRAILILIALALPAFGFDPLVLLCTEDGREDPCYIDTDTYGEVHVESVQSGGPKKGDFTHTSFTIYAQASVYQYDAGTKIDISNTAWTPYTITFTSAGKVVYGPKTVTPLTFQMSGVLGTLYLRGIWKNGTFAAALRMQNMQDPIAKRHFEFKVVPESEALAWRQALQALNLNQ